MNWKRILGGTLAGLLLLLVIATVGGYFYLHSRSFQQFAIREIVKRAELATGGKTQIGRLEINYSTLTARLFDITLRGTEERSLRKSIDGYSIAGPWIVTADELRDPDTIDLILSLNGTIRQHTSASDMLSNVAALVDYAKQFYTLNPGDLIFTGTPSGVGQIQAGDVIEASASGIGTMHVAVHTYRP